MTHILLPLVLMTSQFQPLVIPGERLLYDVNSSRLGDIGDAELRTMTMQTASGQVVRISFETSARVLLFKATDRTVSDLDAATLRTLHYSKRESSPIGKRVEDVTIDYSARTWADRGSVRPLASDDALDELSFIFLMRSIDLAPGETQVLTRHFDATRNPVTVRNITRASDVFDVIEMHVPDKRQASGQSLLRFYFTRDASRLPARIESSMPVAGRITMILKAAS